MSPVYLYVWCRSSSNKAPPDYYLSPRTLVLLQIMVHKHQWDNAISRFYNLTGKLIFCTITSACAADLIIISDIFLFIFGKFDRVLLLNLISNSLYFLASFINLNIQRINWFDGYFYTLMIVQYSWSFNTLLICRDSRESCTNYFSVIYCFKVESNFDRSKYPVFRNTDIIRQGCQTFDELKHFHFNEQDMTKF